jgi:hypothetical protein
MQGEDSMKIVYTDPETTHELLNLMYLNAPQESNRKVLLERIDSIVSNLSKHEKEVTVDSISAALLTPPRRLNSFMLPKEDSLFVFSLNEETLPKLQYSFNQPPGVVDFASKLHHTCLWLRMLPPNIRETARQLMGSVIYAFLSYPSFEKEIQRRIDEKTPGRILVRMFGDFREIEWQDTNKILEPSSPRDKTKEWTEMYKGTNIVVISVGSPKNSFGGHTFLNAFNGRFFLAIEQTRTRLKEHLMRE